MIQKKCRRRLNQLIGTFCRSITHHHSDGSIINHTRFRKGCLHNRHCCASGRCFCNLHRHRRWQRHCARYREDTCRNIQRRSISEGQSRSNRTRSGKGTESVNTLIGSPCPDHLSRSIRRDHNLSAWIIICNRTKC